MLHTNYMVYSNATDMDWNPLDSGVRQCLNQRKAWSIDWRVALEAHAPFQWAWLSTCTWREDCTTNTDILCTKYTMCSNVTYASQRPLNSGIRQRLNHTIPCNIGWDMANANTCTQTGVCQKMSLALEVLKVVSSTTRPEGLWGLLRFLPLPSHPSLPNSNPCPSKLHTSIYNHLKP